MTQAEAKTLELYHLAGMSETVTITREEYEDLAGSATLFRQIADSAPVLNWLAGTDALCNWFNKPWLDFRGRTMEQELGNGWTEGVHKNDFDHCLQIYLRNFEERTPFQMEYRLQRADGEYRWILDHGVPRYTNEGLFLGFIGSCTDITDVNEIKKAWEQAKVLEQSLVQAEKLAATGRMAATIAHELNNPLEAVMNLLYLIRPTIAGEDGRKYLAAAESELARVAHIAKQTLGYYREDASPTVMSLNDVAKQAFAIYEPRCVALGIQLHLSLLSSRMVLLRRGEVMQVISNLVANSIYAQTAGASSPLRLATPKANQ